jgi:phage FluMu protein Com
MASVNTSIRFTCPKCGKVLRTSTRPAQGKKIKCPECAEAFVPDLDDAEESTAIQERPSLTAKAQSSSKNRADDDGDDMPANKRGCDEDDDGRPPRKKRKANQKSGGKIMLMVLFLLGGGGLFMVCAGVGVTAFIWPGFLLGKPDKIAGKNKFAGADKAPENPEKFNYYPVEVGNTWHYRVNANGKITNSSVRISKHETINGEALARLDALNVPVTEHLAQTEKGVFRHRLNGSQVSPPFPLLPYPPKIGAKWQGEFTTEMEKGKNRYFGEIQNEEIVEVPAGKFKTLRVFIKVEQNGPMVQTTYWFAKDVGFVKQSLNILGTTIVMELEKFEGKNALPGP